MVCWLKPRIAVALANFFSPMSPSEQDPSSYSFGSHPTAVSSMSLKSGSLRYSKGEKGLPVTAQAEPKAFFRTSQHPRGGPGLSSAGSRGPWHIPCWVFLLQSQPCRLEPQVFGQEHGEDAAQVVHRRWVQIGLRVVSGVPDRGEGCGDEVEHWDPCGQREDSGPG